MFANNRTSTIKGEDEVLDDEFWWDLKKSGDEREDRKLFDKKKKITMQKNK